jgi:hypothetical protein
MLSIEYSRDVANALFAISEVSLGEDINLAMAELMA